MQEEIKQLKIQVASLENKLKDFQDLERKINSVHDLFFRQHSVDKDIFYNTVVFRGQKIGFFSADPVSKQAAISSPAGGATVDSQARSAIDSIRVVLRNLGLTA